MAQIVRPSATSSTCALPTTGTGLIFPGSTTAVSPKGGQHRQAGCPGLCVGLAHSRRSGSAHDLPGWTLPSSVPIQPGQSILHLRTLPHCHKEISFRSRGPGVKPRSCPSTAPVPHASPSTGRAAVGGCRLGREVCVVGVCSQPLSHLNKSLPWTSGWAPRSNQGQSVPRPDLGVALTIHT